MHHTLRFYSRYQHSILKFYLIITKLTNMPLIGRLVLWLANEYGKKKHHGYLLTFNEAIHIIEESENVALGPCSCRQISHNCDAPIMAEIVVGHGVEIFSQVRSHEFQEISKGEAKKILQQCHQRKLIPTLQKCHKNFYAICNCCTCCCIPLRLSQNYKISSALIRDKMPVEEFRKDHRNHNS